MKKEKKSSIFWILIIFFVLFSIWQLWVPEALDDWRWGSEVGIMRLKTWFEGYNGRYFGDILVIVLTRLPIVLRSMAISGIMTAMLYLIYQLTEYKILSFLICVFFVVNIPTSLMSHSEVGFCLGGLGKYEEAAEEFKKAIEMGRDDSWIFAISYIYFQRKESVEVENRDFNDQCISWKLGS